MGFNHDFYTGQEDRLSGAPKEWYLCFKSIILYILDCEYPAILLLHSGMDNSPSLPSF